METSYREKQLKLKLKQRFTDEEIDTVVKSTVTLLRRHNVDGTLCPRCQNDDPETFSVNEVDVLGFITEVKCERCERYLSTICRHSRCRYEAINDPSVLRPGDHVSWHRPYLIWHHAVVTEQDPVGKEITVHEYTISGDGPYAAVIKTNLSYAKCTSFRSGELYRLVYDDSYTNDYVVLRTLKSFGEKKYDVFEHNCEHSTRWCKTGIHDSIQMEVCFTTAGKIAVIVLLRLISLIMLWLLQLSHESQPRSERSREQERLINAVYMVFIAFVFFAYSLYHSYKRIWPKETEKRHDTDLCGIEAGRRWCADVTHKHCCCGARSCNAVVLALCCVSCMMCSMTDAFCSVCRKNIQCGATAICLRPPSVMIGLFLRIFVREVIAATGPLLVVYFEEEIGSRFGSREEKAGIIILAIIGASLVAYVIGALLGVWIEALFRCCANCCCGRTIYNRDPAKEEIHLTSAGDE